MWLVTDAFPAPDYYPRSHTGYAGTGPLPCKRWVPHRDDPKRPKLAYHWKPCSAPVNRETVLDYNTQQARKYIAWIAKRDGISLPHGEPRAINASVMIGNKYCPRIRGIAWGYDEEIYNTRKDGRRGAFLYKQWVETSRIEIPNWDFVHPPIEQCESV